MSTPDLPYQRASLLKIVEQLEFCDYADGIGHQLKNNVAFIELKRRAKEDENAVLFLHKENKALKEQYEAKMRKLGRALGVLAEIRTLSSGW